MIPIHFWISTVRPLNPPAALHLPFLLLPLPSCAFSPSCPHRHVKIQKEPFTSHILLGLVKNLNQAEKTKVISILNQLQKNLLSCCMSPCLMRQFYPIWEGHTTIFGQNICPFHYHVLVPRHLEVLHQLGPKTFSTPEEELQPLICAFPPDCLALILEIIGTFESYHLSMTCKRLYSLYQLLIPQPPVLEHLDTAAGRPKAMYFKIKLHSLDQIAGVLFKPETDEGSREPAHWLFCQRFQEGTTFIDIYTTGNVSDDPRTALNSMGSPVGKRPVQLVLRPDDVIGICGDFFLVWPVALNRYGMNRGKATIVLIPNSFY